MKRFEVPTSSSLDWLDLAVCGSEDPEIFFPVFQSNVDAVAIAKKICERCEAKTECLNWAADTGQEFGIWGGMSQDELRAYRTRRARKS